MARIRNMDVKKMVQQRMKSAFLGGGDIDVEPNDEELFEELTSACCNAIVECVRIGRIRNISAITLKLPQGDSPFPPMVAVESADGTFPLDFEMIRKKGSYHAMENLSADFNYDFGNDEECAVDNYRIIAKKLWHEPYLKTVAAGDDFKIRITKLK